MAPPASVSRPTSDRVREAIFDILTSLGEVEDAEVLDLFAGSGALGIEALSRGAAAVTFVESDRRAVATVEANLAAAGFAAAGPAGGPGVAKVVRAEALGWCATTGRRFDLALCDPPYRFEDWDRLLEHLPADLAVLESSRPIRARAGWEVHRCYRYGSTLVTVAAQRGAAPEDTS